MIYPKILIGIVLTLKVITATTPEETLINLEQEREQAFIHNDIATLDRCSCEIYACVKRYIAENSSSLQMYLHAIVKTRRLYPGKPDLLWYLDTKISPTSVSSMTLPELSNQPPLLTLEPMTLIIAADFLADVYFQNTPIDFHNAAQVDQYFQETLQDHQILPSFNEKTRIELTTLATTHTEVVQQIYQISTTMAPLLTFTHVYQEIMTHPFYQGYEVVGLEQYAHWPEGEDVSTGEKRLFQQFLSQPRVQGKIFPMSIEAFCINEEAFAAFPLLRERSGSFIPYGALLDLPQPMRFLLVHPQSSSHRYTPAYEEVLQRYTSCWLTNDNTSIETLLTRADQGVAQAQYAYALTLHKSPVTTEIGRYKEYLLRAAKQGHRQAQFRLGNLYYKGLERISPQIHKAYEWWLQAAAQGCPTSQYNVGALLEYGLGIEQNIDQARAWYQRAATQGQQKAQQRLQNMTET